MHILVTGVAGFIGFHFTNQILKKKKIKIIGIDNINSYYDVDLKIDRLKILKKNKNFKFFKIDIKNKKKLYSLLNYKFDYILHLAAQAGVRYSITNPTTYFNNNIKGFFNILEFSREKKIKHLVYASTSSVYGNNANFPLKETLSTSKPLSLYAASKKTNEILAYSYSNIYKIPTTGLRFFTVYGPYGRPDMALFKFTKLIIEKKNIELFNHGDHSRDFTFVDDIVSGIISIINKPSKNIIPYNLFNIAGGKKTSLKKYLNIIEDSLNLKAKIKNLPLQKGDVKITHGSINKIKSYSNYSPKFNIEKGISIFLEWYKKYYK
jgi:UDP-glucuronate 4-epimerase